MPSSQYHKAPWVTLKIHLFMTSKHPAKVNTKTNGLRVIGHCFPKSRAATRTNTQLRAIEILRGGMTVSPPGLNPQKASQATVCIANVVATANYGSHFVSGYLDKS
jgi:hypothetical protein